MKFKTLAPFGLLCLGFGLVGCSGNVDDMPQDENLGYMDEANNNYDPNGNTGYTNPDLNANGEYSSDNSNGNDLNDNNLNDETINGESLTNQINGIFGRYSIDGSVTPENYNSNYKSNLTGTDTSYNYGNKANNTAGYSYGYGDGLDTTIRNNSRRFGFGMKGAENIIGNNFRWSNNDLGNTTYRSTINNQDLNETLMS